MEDANTSANGRVEKAANIWLATVRPDGRPHLVPIWFVVDQERWYICTAPESVKAHNLKANPRVAVALEDGSNPYVVEGEARPVEPGPGVVRKFKEKYDWDITTDGYYSQVFEVTVKKHLMRSG